MRRSPILTRRGHLANLSTRGEEGCLFPIGIDSDDDGEAFRPPPTNPRAPRPIVATGGCGAARGGANGGGTNGSDAFGAGSLWVVQGVGGKLTVVDPVARAVIDQIQFPSNHGGVAQGAGAVWLSNVDKAQLSVYSALP